MTTPPVASPPASPRRFPVWLIILLAVGGGFFALALCGILAVGGLTLLGQRVETTRTITASDGQSIVSVPNSWTAMTDLHDSAEIQVGNRARDEYLIVQTTNKADLIADPDTYAELMLERLKYNVDSPRVSNVRDFTINGHDVIQYEVHASVNNRNLVFWLTAIDGSQNYYQVLGWTPESKAEQSKPVIQKVVQSFQEVVQR